MMKEDLCNAVYVSDMFGRAEGGWNHSYLPRSVSSLLIRLRVMSYVLTWSVEEVGVMEGWWKQSASEKWLCHLSQPWRRLRLRSCQTLRSDAKQGSRKACEKFRLWCWASGGGCNVDSEVAK